MKQKEVLGKRKDVLRHMDQLFIRPMTGRSRLMTLTRKKYILLPSADNHFLIDGYFIYLPGPLPVNFEAILELNYSTVKDRESCINGYYTLKTLNGDYFTHNGNLTAASVVFRNDRAVLAYNEFQFKSKKENFLAPQQIVGPGICKSSINILLTGQTGVGKTHHAKEIHDLSERIGRFVHISLSSFSEGLIESEIFGHERGAFTGAVREHRGAIEEANHGTLFIDEIDSLPLDIQAKLLLFLDKKEYRKVGGRGTRRADVRLIFASGSRLEELVKLNKFRIDLFFRIQSGIVKNIKPLSERPKFLKKLLEDFCQKNHMNYDRELLEFYLKYSWPGNVRQFLGHLERKHLVSKSSRLALDEYDLNLKDELSLMEADVAESETLSLQEYCDRYILNVFHRFNQKTIVASKALDISPNTLRRKVKRLKAG